MRISPPKGGSRNKLSELQQNYIVIRHIIRPKLPRICRVVFSAIILRNEPNKSLIFS